MAEACASVICGGAATKWEEADLCKSSAEQTHSTQFQQQQLLKIFNKHASLFQGSKNEQSGIFNNGKCHINLNLGAKPCHIKQPHSVPPSQVNDLLGIPEKCCATKWGMPVFAILETNGSCRLIADFCKLSEVATPAHCPLPET